MEPSSLRTLLTLCLAFLFFQSQANPTYDVTEIKARLEAMECIVKPRFTSAVEGYIRGYLGRSAAKAGRVMGRAATYFPIYEKYLKEHGLPSDLKYLSIVESALVPVALSRVGAGGLWQFMKVTGREFDLVINHEVDERSCAHSSTDAAMKYLIREFERYGSWELALAAYNCGAGNINKAIRRARTDDFWKLSRYLPRETQNFVPAFLGAAYVVNYYHLHDVKPRYPSLDMQLLDETQVYAKTDFKTIAAVTGLPEAVVNDLNPTFKKGYIPENEKGFYLLLPSRVTPAFRDYLELLRPDNDAPDQIPAIPDILDTSNYRPDDYYFQSIYTVAEGDNLEELAKLFKCSVYHLKVWNDLTSTRLTKGQELKVWFPKEIVHFGKENRKVGMIQPPPQVRSAPVKRLPQPKLNKVKDDPARSEEEKDKKVPAILETKLKVLVASTQTQKLINAPVSPASEMDQKHEEEGKGFLNFEKIKLKLPSFLGGKKKDKTK